MTLKTHFDKIKKTCSSVSHEVATAFTALVKRPLRSLASAFVIVAIVQGIDKTISNEQNGQGCIHVPSDVATKLPQTIFGNIASRFSGNLRLIYDSALEAWGKEQRGNPNASPPRPETTKPAPPPLPKTSPAPVKPAPELTPEEKLPRLQTESPNIWAV